ncbi:hypothetical protein AB0P15_32065 [Streptomyces sp. NPDC087917]|uniref:hypothetical protein n=1 Tax=Streptomyces sp. NPDC087917 TaxID=3155060 RepID=UPI003425B0DB
MRKQKIRRAAVAVSANHTSHATKAAVVALSEGLRREISGSGVHVTCVLPYLVATRAGEGLRPRLVQPLRLEQVARAVARAIRRPPTRIYVPGPLGRLLAYASQLPERARDAVDDLIRMDELALAPQATPRQRFGRRPTAEPPPSLHPEPGVQRRRVR